MDANNHHLIIVLVKSNCIATLSSTPPPPAESKSPPTQNTILCQRLWVVGRSLSGLVWHAWRQRGAVIEVLVEAISGHLNIIQFSIKMEIDIKWGI